MSAPPIPYTRQANFTNFATEQFPTTGQDLEAEFNKLAQSVGSTQSRLAEIQRDDGLLANLSVHPDSLSHAVRSLLAAEAGVPRGNWAPGVIYQPKDVVMHDGASYLAATEHTAGADFDADLAAGKWLLLSFANDGGTLRVDLASPAPGNGASLVQYDADETVKDRLDALGNLRADLASSAPGNGASLVQYNVAETVKDRLDALGSGGGAALVGFQQAGSGAVQRNAQDKMREWVTPEDFGAVGDGVADDSPAIQAALDAAAGGTVVFTQNRVYKLFQPLQVPSNTTVVATGATFVCGPGIDNMLRNKADGVTGGYNANNNITIIGGTWIGDSGVNMSPFAFGHCSHVLISGVEIINNNRYHHIEINSSAGVRVRDCIFRGGLDWCENVGSGYDVTLNEAIQIDNAGNSGQFPWFGPYDGTPCRDIEISGCQFLDVGTGIGTHSNVAAGLEPHTRINIHDNYFSNVFWAAIKALSWSDINISRNRIQSSYHGILVLQSDVRWANTIIITNNTVYRLGYGNAPTSYGVSCGILVDGVAGGSYNPRNVVVTGNVLLGGDGPTGAHGILVKHNADAAVVSGNVVNSFNRDGIYINGAELCTVTGNTANQNNRAGGAFSDFKLGGTGSTSDSTRITCVGNTGGTMTVTFTRNTIVRNNNLYTSLTASDNEASTIIGENIVGTTFS